MVVIEVVLYTDLLSTNIQPQEQRPFNDHVVTTCRGLTAQGPPFLQVRI